MLDVLDTSADMILDDDTILPAQWLQRHLPKLSPTAQLWLAVLTEAVCLATARRVASDVMSRTHGSREVRRAKAATAADEAREWIASDADDIGSFRWVCDILHLDAEWIRRKMPTHMALRTVVNHLHLGGSGRTSVGAREVA